MGMMELEGLNAVEDNAEERTCVLGSKVVFAVRRARMIMNAILKSAGVFMGYTCVIKRNTQHANPAAIILSRAKITPLDPSGSERLRRSIIKIIQVASPKIASTPTSPPQTPNVAFLHRFEIIHDTAHEHNKIRLTIRTSAAHISDNNSVVKDIAPIAINTKQNIVGASPIFQLTPQQTRSGKGGAYNCQHSKNN